MINLSKLKKLVQKDGKIEAQCPACSAAGADSKGNHLVVYPNGAFSCVANPDDKEHNRTILKLAGERGSLPAPQLVIRRETIPDITTLLRIGHIGRENLGPVEKPEEKAHRPDDEVTANRPVRPQQALDSTLPSEDAVDSEEVGSSAEAA